MITCGDQEFCVPACGNCLVSQQESSFKSKSWEFSDFKGDMSVGGAPVARPLLEQCIVIIL